MRVKATLTCMKGHQHSNWALGLVSAALLLIGASFVVELDRPTAPSLLLVAAMLCLCLTSGVLLAALRENAERVKAEVEGR
jgi:hypothetical protein